MTDRLLSDALSIWDGTLTAKSFDDVRAAALRIRDILSQCSTKQDDDEFAPVCSILLSIIETTAALPPDDRSFDPKAPFCPPPLPTASSATVLSERVLTWLHSQGSLTAELLAGKENRQHPDWALMHILESSTTPLGKRVLESDRSLAPDVATQYTKDAVEVLVRAAECCRLRALTEASRLIILGIWYGVDWSVVCQDALKRLANTAGVPPLVTEKDGEDAEVKTMMFVCALLRRSGDLGDGLAWMLLAEESGDKDSTELLKRAAECGCDDAVLALAERQFYGIGCAEDERGAVAAWMRLAARGNSDALLRLGSLYEEGIPGVIGANRRLAYCCIEGAVARGNEGAVRKLGEYLLDGIGTEVAVLRGLKYLRSSSDYARGDPVLLSRLLDLTHEGIELHDADSAIAILTSDVPAFESTVLACLRVLVESLTEDSDSLLATKAVEAVEKQCSDGRGHGASAAVLMFEVLQKAKKAGCQDVSAAEKALIHLAEDEIAAEEDVVDDVFMLDAGDEEEEGRGAWAVPGARTKLQELLRIHTVD